ncbi:Pyruvate kinase [Blattella germanica]|nr:Pyruvate kinase [Blattella germanica]
MEWSVKQSVPVRPNKRQPRIDSQFQMLPIDGPSSKSVEKLEQMLECGMNIARMNFSHGTHEYHAETVRNVRQAVNNYSKRIGYMHSGGSAEVELVKGNNITLTTDPSFEEKGTQDCVYVDYQNITNNGGMLGSKKGINLPGLPVDLPAISEKDKGDLEFGVEQEVDIIFASFIRNGSALKEIRDILELEFLIRLCDKIKSSFLARFLKIAVAVNVLRKWILYKVTVYIFLQKGKPVICATQMLESMTYKPRPTRAEVSDVANAVLDGADCVMLSGESAKGTYPLETIQTMANICKQAENSVWLKQVDIPIDPAHAIAVAAVEVSQKTQASAIVVITTSGLSAQLVSRYKPRCPILAITRHAKAARQLNLWRSIIPLYYITPPTQDWMKDVDARIQFAITYGKVMGFIKPGNAIVLVSGWKQGAGFTNTLRVIYASPTEEF